MASEKFTAPQKDSCPECNGRIESDESRGEHACVQCGLIIEEDTIDHGPEWRSFQNESNSEQQRTGPARTITRHDDGLGAEIGYDDINDGNKRRRIARQRTLDERIDSTKDRNTVTVLIEVRRICNALDLGQNQLKRACQIAREAHQDGFVFGGGRSLEGLAAVAVYGACRVTGASRRLSEIAEHCVKDDNTLRQLYFTLNQEYNLAAQVPRVTDHVHRIASELNLWDSSREAAIELVDVYAESTNLSGYDPAGIAGAALYLVCDTVSQRRIADAADSTPKTLRQHTDAMHNMEVES